MTPTQAHENTDDAGDKDGDEDEAIGDSSLGVDIDTGEAGVAAAVVTIGVALADATGADLAIILPTLLVRV